MTFKDLHIVTPILKALQKIGYVKPTPIQEQAIPLLLRGKDLLGCAQTGTGKTAAFAIPIIQNLFLEEEEQRGKKPIKALVVAPTRELALQIQESFQAYSKFMSIRSMVIFGGVKQHAQVEGLRKGTDILVATPGRLLDLINQGFISLNLIEYFVLDEADHMLDMGFIHDIKKIIKLLPKHRQSLFFSATMSPEILALSRKILGQPERITIAPKQTTAERVNQSLYFVSKRNKRKLLLHLLKTESIESLLVFSRTKYGADKIARVLKKAGIEAAAIHGNKSQNARQKALGQFKNRDINVLVATDIAARGIDVDELSHVINYDLPNVAETYVHRIGRTGRANASGEAISFCDVEEKDYLKSIQKLIAQTIPVVDEHPFPYDAMEEAVAAAELEAKYGKQKSNPRKGNRSKGKGKGRSFNKKRKS